MKLKKNIAAFRAAGLLAAMALTFLACDMDDTPNNNSEKDIRQAIEAQQAAWNTGDIERFLTYYKNTDHLSFVTSSGILKGYEPLLKRYNKAYPTQERMGRLEFEILEFHQLGDKNALVVGKWLLRRAGDTPEGYFTLIWEETSEGWRIILDHTS